MKFNILNLDGILSQAKTLFKSIPTDDLQKRWDAFSKKVVDKLENEYFNHIEKLNLELTDQQDAINKLILQNAELQAKLESTMIRDNRMEKMQSELNTAYHQINKLKSDLEIEMGNRNHFRELVATNDTFMIELKKQIATYKTDKQKETSDLNRKLTEKTGEAEHLAKQSIRLTEENATLRLGITELTTKNEELTALNSQLNTQTPLLMAENDKYREQPVRLVEEKHLLQETINEYMGIAKDVGERLAHSEFIRDNHMEKMQSESVRLVEEKRLLQEQVNEYRGIAEDGADRLAHSVNTIANLQHMLDNKQKINDLNSVINVILTNVLTKLNAMPWYAWGKKKELLATYPDRIYIFQEEINLIQSCKHIDMVGDTACQATGAGTKSA